jgi:hypothetical protein
MKVFMFCERVHMTKTEINITGVGLADIPHTLNTI